MKLIKSISLVAISFFVLATASAQTVELVKAEKVQLNNVVAMAEAEIKLSLEQVSVQSPAQAFESLLVKQTTTKDKNEKSVKLAQLSE